ncbi:MAG: SDR family oxidoreductase [Candidatus Angelobacter sp. Gp1-AA117]|nr:MAG: SDR family oxidoreductase [Candidatus Angelobacter sp. Gp1-AA117]
MNAVITGASRGLGLEFVRQLAGRGDRVFATARDPQTSKELQSLISKHPDRISAISLDVTSEASIRSALQQVSAMTESIDLLINNAGVLLGMSAMKDTGQADRLGRLTMEHGATVMMTNAIGPILVTQEFLPLLRKGKHPRIASITSGYGSLAHTSTGNPYHYKASKAALNMYMHGLAVDLCSDGIISVVINPGWVSTAMGGSAASLTPEQSVSGMVKLIDKLTLQQTGGFFDWQGHEEPW